MKGVGAISLKMKINTVPLFLLRQMQALKRMEHALAIATEQLQFTQSIYNELQAQVICWLLLSICVVETSSWSVRELVFVFLLLFFWHLVFFFCAPEICVTLCKTAQFAHIIAWEHSDFNSKSYVVITGTADLGTFSMLSTWVWKHVECKCHCANNQKKNLFEFPVILLICTVFKEKIEEE